jgi:hypothetical protein
VPEVCAEFAALESAAVRNRFVFDILATYHCQLVAQTLKKRRSLTSRFCLSQAGTHFACTYTNHTQALRFVERSDFLFCFTKRHPISQFSEFGLIVCLLGFASTSYRRTRQRLRKQKSVGRDAYRLPPRRFLGPSFGIANALTTFDGGGAVNRSSSFSIFSLSSSP